MKWISEKTEKVGVSTLGWRRPARFLPATELVWSEEADEVFGDLHDLARAWGFTWNVGANVGTIDQGGIAARLADGEKRERILKDTLNDISWVANRKGLKSPEGFSRHSAWSLGRGSLKVFLLRPGSIGPDGTGTGFSRVCFLLKLAGPDGRPARHFYQWGMLNADPYVLDVRRPVKDWRITHMEQVDTRVWVTTSAENGARAVLKVEPSPNVERLACVAFLARHVFDATAETVQGTPEDVAEIPSLTPTQGNRYVTTDPKKQSAELLPHAQLVQSLNDFLVIHPAVGQLCRIEFRTMLPNLEKQMLRVNTLQGANRAAALLALHQAFFREANFRRLGKIAVFDIMVNNRDRLNPGKKTFGQALALELNNFDLDGAGQPIALDNFDPGGGIQPESWPDGDDRLATDDKIQLYVRRVLDAVVNKTEAGAFLQPDARARMHAAFEQGIARGKRTLVEFLIPHGKSLRARFGATGREIHRRISQLRDAA